MLALPLFMLGFHLINNVNTPFSADDNVIWTDFLNACTHFHADHPFVSYDSLLNIMIGDR